MTGESTRHTPPPALAVVEVASLARGVQVSDALCKKAPVELLQADPVTPGKLLIVFTGEVAEVEESLEAAREVAGVHELDVLVLPHAHPALVPALGRGVQRGSLDGALGVLELNTAAATLLAADRALKETDVALVALHLARGIGGKGYVAFAGTQDAVEASLDAGEGAVDMAHRAGRELIARPHEGLDWVLGRL
jgi:microcompartment protein CcmL/EutN